MTDFQVHWPKGQGLITLDCDWLRPATIESILDSIEDVPEAKAIRQKLVRQYRALMGRVPEREGD